MFDSPVPALVSLKLEKEESDRTTYVKDSQIGSSYSNLCHFMRLLNNALTDKVCDSKWNTNSLGSILSNV